MSKRKTFFTPTNILISLILLLAFVLRIYRVTEVPPSIYWEEAALGYDAYSILKTGKDFHGNTLPLVSFVSFGDYKPALYFYAVVPSVYLFGLTELAVRFPSILAGVGAVFGTFLVGKTLYGRRVGLLAGAFLAIQPWSLHLSRVGFETNLATCLIVYGIYFFLSSKGRLFRLILSSVLFSGSMYAYHSARMMAPLFAGVLALLTWTKWKTRYLFLGLLTASLLTAPILVKMGSPEVQQRIAETSLFADLEIIKESNALKERFNNSLFSRVVYHRYLISAEHVLLQYANNFDPRFLFMYGDDNNRHNSREFGVLYHWELLTIFAGIYWIAKRRTRNAFIPIIWILIAAIPVSLTTVSPHTLRFAAAAPAFAVVSALGAFQLLASTRKNIKVLGVLAFFMVFSIEFFAYAHYYLRHYPRVSAFDWQYGYKQLYQSLRENEKPDDTVVVSREYGRPSMYYLFYLKKDPLEVQKMDDKVAKDQGELLEVDNYRFEKIINQEVGTLFATGPQLVPQNAETVSEMYAPDNTVVWVIWRTP